MKANFGNLETVIVNAQFILSCLQYEVSETISEILSWRMAIIIPVDSPETIIVSFWLN